MLLHVLLVAGTVLGPFVVLVLAWLWPSLRFAFGIAAFICGDVAGGISAVAVSDILRTNTVYMTEIHRVFENFWFLLSGAYLGVYALYRLLARVIEEFRAS